MHAGLRSTAGCAERQPLLRGRGDEGVSPISLGQVLP